MDTSVEINKSAFARNIMKQIGALSENPPKGWISKLEQSLASENISMRRTYLYHLRRNYLERLRNLDDSPRQSRTAIARSVIKAMGFLVSKPPKGWIRKTEEELAKQGIHLSRMSLYIARRTAMSSDNVDAKNDFKIDSNTLIAFNDFAKQHGGLEAMEKMIEVLKLLKS